jgi:hypothetical protein
MPSLIPKHKQSIWKFELLHKCHKLPGLRLREVNVVENYDVARRYPPGEGNAERGTHLLLVDFEVVRTRERAEDNTTTTPLRGPRRTLPGPPCTLLLPRFPTTAADIRTPPRSMRPLPARRKLLAHHEMQQVIPAGLTKNPIVKIRLTDDLTVLTVNTNLSHQTPPFTTI